MQTGRLGRIRDTLDQCGIELNEVEIELPKGSVSIKAITKDLTRNKKICHLLVKNLLRSPASRWNNLEFHIYFVGETGAQLWDRFRLHSGCRKEIL